MVVYVEMNRGNVFKIRLKGFYFEYRDMWLFKLRNYIVWKKVDDGVWMREGGLEGEVMDVVGGMVGFVMYLNRIVMFDLGDEDDSEDEEEEE